MFDRDDDVVSFQPIEHLVGRGFLDAGFLAEIGVDDIGYIVYIYELSFHFSQFVNNFVEIYHLLFCFKIKYSMVYI